MSHIFYVDVPYGYDYDWELVRNLPGGLLAGSGEEVLTKQYGVDMRFICNHIAKISKGDVHRVTVESEGDELLFLLKTNFTKVPTDVARKVDLELAADKERKLNSYRKKTRDRSSTG